MLKKNSTMFLHHDNAPARSLLSMCDSRVKNHTAVLPRPPYSPDSDTADYFQNENLRRKDNDLRR